MILRWDGDRVLADRPMVADLYGVSVATVRRYCTAVDKDRDTGSALLDALVAGEALAGVVARPERTAAAIRARIAAARADSSR